LLKVLAKKDSKTMPKPTLRIIAPSGAMETPDILPIAARRLSRMGFNVQLDAQAQLIEQRFAGSDTQRATALQAALLDPAVNIVMAARGGYGAHRLLPLIDWARVAQAVRTQGKHVVGHSDFTAIQMALLRHGAPSLAGPCAGVDFGGETCNAFMKQAFLTATKTPPHSNQTNQTNQTITFKTSPTAAVNLTGVLWGGNLAMLCSLLGTPYFPLPEQIKQGILFLEDTNERPFRVERMLNQLHLAGVLGSQQAVLWGDFGQPAIAEYDRGYGLDSVINYARITLGLGERLITGLPFGHCAKKLSLPVGMNINLSITGNINAQSTATATINYTQAT
jgi:muramoyltetrapeptide carboxypeptidase